MKLPEGATDLEVQRVADQVLLLEFAVPGGTAREYVALPPVQPTERTPAYLPAYCLPATEPPS